MFSDKFKEALSHLDCECIFGAPMKNYTSFKTGGAADILVTPGSVEALIEILRLAGDIPVTVIGNGSNLLVSDGGIRGLVILTCGLCDISVENGVIRCSAGIPLSKLCLTALENSLTGLEFAYGIPGSLGGAVYMNAGAFGGEMKDVVSLVRHIGRDLRIGEYSRGELDFSYRRSIYCENGYIVTGAEIFLEKGNAAEIKARMDDILGRRRDKQPLEYPSAGSTFKRPEGHYAGAIIEELGLKGFAIGGAAVSQKHANFVINTGGATSADILNLIRHIQEQAYSRMGITLETEVKMIGF